MTPQDITAAWNEKSAARYFGATPTNDNWWNLAPAARDLALSLHKEQLRKDSALPYAIHLGEVALIVNLFHGMGLIETSDVVAATTSAWLHDSIEDQGATKDMIASRFGENIGGIVDALSKRQKSEHMPDPMADSLARINKAGKIASLIKIADRISNLSTCPPASWSVKSSKKYAQEARTIIAHLNGNLPPLAGLILESIAADYIAAHCAGNRHARP